MMAEAIVESTSKDEENKSPWSRPQAACLIEDISTDSGEKKTKFTGSLA